MGPRRDLFENLFEPMVIMRHQKAIGLTDEQTSAIRTEMRKSGERFFDLHWQQNSEEEALTTLLKEPRPDEKQVTAQFNKLLTVEDDIKRGRMELLVRLKNILTPEQQAKLKELAPPGTPKGPQGLQRSRGPEGPKDGPQAGPRKFDRRGGGHRGPGMSEPPGGPFPPGRPETPFSELRNRDERRTI